MCIILFISICCAFDFALFAVGGSLMDNFLKIYSSVNLSLLCIAIIFTMFYGKVVLK